MKKQIALHHKHHLPRQIYIGIILGLLFALPLFMRVATAKTPAGGITITPALVNISLGTKQDHVSTVVTVKNTFGTPQDFHAELKGVDQSRGILVPSKPLPIGIADSLSVSPRTFTLAPNQSINLTLTMRASNALAPGGNYAALLVQTASPTGSAIGLQPGVSVGIFMVKEQGAVRDIQAKDLKPPLLALSPPDTINTTVSNTGNVLIVPRGVVTITKNGRVVSKGIYNDSSLPLFPGDDLRLQTSLRTVERLWLPGRYELTMHYRYEGSPTNKTLTRTFFYLPVWSIVSFVALLLGILLLIRGIIKTSRPAPVKLQQRLIIKPAPAQTRKNKKPSPLAATPKPTKPQKKSIPVNDSTDGDRIPVRRRPKS